MVFVCIYEQIPFVQYTGYTSRFYIYQFHYQNALLWYPFLNNQALTPQKYFHIHPGNQINIQAFPPLCPSCNNLEEFYFIKYG